MSEHPQGETGWWRVEPPEYDLEPGEDRSFLAETYYPEPGVDDTMDILVERNYLDGTESHPLFKDVRVTEEDGALCFDVPKRFVDTPAHGKWILEAFGGRRWFKERDDYGKIRFTSSGTALWIPHLFPFEETDDRGVPLIRDRERCEVIVSLQSMNNDFDSPIVTALQTPYGALRANESPESYSPDATRYFTEFAWQDKQLVSEIVTHSPRRWDSFDDFLIDRNIKLSAKDYLDVRLGKKYMPEFEDYFNQGRPNDWQEREPSGYTGEAFGSIWVPVDSLRRGIEADISFPSF